MCEQDVTKSVWRFVVALLLMGSGVVAYVTQSRKDFTFIVKSMSVTLP